MGSKFCTIAPDSLRLVLRVHWDFFFCEEDGVSANLLATRVNAQNVHLILLHFTGRSFRGGKNGFKTAVLQKDRV